MFKANFRRPRIPQDIKTLIPKQTPTWGAGPGNEGSAKATWLGYAMFSVWAVMLRVEVDGYIIYSHACYLVELPAPPGAARGVRIIFDPVFSNRCSPFRWLGPARYTGMSLAQLVAFLILACNFFPRSSLHNRRGPCSRCHCSFGMSILFTRVIVVDPFTSTITMTSIHDPFVVLTDR